MAGLLHDLAYQYTKPICVGPEGQPFPYNLMAMES